MGQSRDVADVSAVAVSLLSVGEGSTFADPKLLTAVCTSNFFLSTETSRSNLHQVWTQDL